MLLLDEPVGHLACLVQSVALALEKLKKQGFTLLIAEQNQCSVAWPTRFCTWPAAICLTQLAELAQLHLHCRVYFLGFLTCHDHYQFAGH